MPDLIFAAVFGVLAGFILSAYLIQRVSDTADGVCQAAINTYEKEHARRMTEYTTLGFHPEDAKRKAREDMHWEATEAEATLDGKKSAHEGCGL